jgi:REP element-mobilizing transposase RayT
MPGTSRNPSGGASEALAGYDDDGRSATWIEYHVLLVTRRRQPYFADERARARVDELLRAAAAGVGCEVLDLDVWPSSAHVRVKAPPAIAPHMVVRALRRGVAGPLKAEFEAIRRVGAVFVRPYLLATRDVPEADREAFARRVPTR